ncbi:N-acetylneuraminate synthase [Caproiciproducens faecalis]|uniref:N-acetylneuraminate synthase n=1 Tax=Caproiciproducens faecalis TaxID=2820301 RepID=A0ABS7DM19_9FIRM|nr:N-acetylneuraminate synthase [Caproiciproducens faecalis]MBW7572353.1 N-acetylneuraminate synthase [Caproiciproducens faecalis]
MGKILIVAEAGVNHNGRMDLAYRLIDAAAEAGADYVKFQTWKSEAIISKYAQKAEYQKESTGAEESMLDMVKKLELSFENFRRLKEHCDAAGVGFLSTPFDVESARFLSSLGMKIMKVPSGEITNLPLLETIAGLPGSVLLSTGMSEVWEIREAVSVLQKDMEKDITVLHCNTQYPTPLSDVNLRVMRTLKEQLGLPVGLSDHSQGIEVPVAAAALGAQVIEKHFTLSRGMKGPDHRASIEPDELCRMVRYIRNIEQAMGSGEKHVTDSERENRSLVRKSIVASQKILKGEVFTPENITAKRPGAGISPMRWNEVLGAAAIRDFEEDELIAF